ncbi:MAG TPA: hypothetical protein VFR34_15000 [Paracoccaceae bacterium]|nr:hypothetical protein [Paracoccaceae bacterium]
MLGTIIIGTCVSVQGELVHRFSDGRICVKVGEQIYTGRAVNPVEPMSARLASPPDYLRSVA